MLVESWFSLAVVLEPLQDCILTCFFPDSAYIPKELIAQDHTSDSVLILGVKDLFCLDVELNFNVFPEGLSQKFPDLLAELFG